MFAIPENDRGRTTVATLYVLAVTVLDAMTARQLSRQPEMPVRERMTEGIRSKRGTTISRPATEAPQSWRDFGSLPQRMRHLESVAVTGDRRSHRVARAPGGRSAEPRRARAVWRRAGRGRMIAAPREPLSSLQGQS